jgi:hypothetical protein
MWFWSRKGKLVWVVIGLLAYFGLAAWLTRFYDDPTPQGKIVIRTYLPFVKLSGSEYIARPTEIRTLRSIEGLSNIADSNDNNRRSPVVLYEDGHPLGPAHSLHADIADLGMGRYSHWTTEGVRFSTSDNSDPNSNGRHYWIVVP